MKANNNPTSKELRNFGLITGAIFGLLFGLLFPWLGEKDTPLWPWIILVVFWAWAILAPSTMRRFYKIWMKVGLGLGWVNSRIILSIMYYLIILPTGLVMMMFVEDPMRRKFDASVTSYRRESRKRDKNHVERPF